MSYREPDWQNCKTLMDDRRGGSGNEGGGGALKHGAYSRIYMLLYVRRRRKMQW